MPNFVFVQCPNCKLKIKIDQDKKYHDCPDCKFEFRIDQVAAIAPVNNVVPKPKESVFGKFLRENNLL